MRTAEEGKEPEMVIDCPTCYRGYYGDIKSGFWSDRELTIEARAVVNPFDGNIGGIAITPNPKE